MKKVKCAKCGSKEIFKNRMCEKCWIENGGESFTEKECATCGLTKAIDEFGWNKTKKHWLHSCIECTAKYMKEYYEKRIADPNNELNSKDPDKDYKQCSKCKEFRLYRDFHRREDRGSYASSCKFCSGEDHKVYLSDPDNRELKKRADKKWRDENKDRKRENDRQWRINNSERKSLNEQRRRALKLEAYNDGYTTDDLMDLIEEQNHRCAYCDVELHGPLADGIQANRHLDHIWPINGRRNEMPPGHNAIYNLQYLCNSCNSSKNSSDPILYEKRRGILTDDRYVKLLELKRKMFADDLPENHFEAAHYKYEFKFLEKHYGN